jgi:hypothetical protein
MATIYLKKRVGCFYFFTAFEPIFAQSIRFCRAQNKMKMPCQKPLTLSQGCVLLILGSLAVYLEL